MQSKIRGRGSWRDFSIYSSQFSPRLIGDREWLTGLCWLCDTLASLVRVTHNQLETTIPLSMCCCSKERRTTNMRHSQVSLKSILYWTCDWLELVVWVSHNLCTSTDTNWSHDFFGCDRNTQDLSSVATDLMKLYDYLVAPRSSWNVTGA